MAANLIQSIADKMDEVQQFLEDNPGGVDEPSKTVKDSLFSDLDRFMSRWVQPMTRLNNYQALRDTIHNQLTPQNQTWFYIGRTTQALSTYYLWNKIPENNRFKDAQKRLRKLDNPSSLVKSHTYYTYLVDTAPLENEFELIDGCRASTRCLNVDNGISAPTGIVYVLVYTAQPNIQ